MEQHGEELAQLETLEQGKSIAISRAFEVGCTLNWCAHRGLTTKTAGRWTFRSRSRRRVTRRGPKRAGRGGGGHRPVEFPADDRHLWKVMPALAAGCSIVIKPSETTPLTPLRVAGR